MSPVFSLLSIPAAVETCNSIGFHTAAPLCVLVKCSVVCSRPPKPFASPKSFFAAHKHTHPHSNLEWRPHRLPVRCVFVWSCPTRPAGASESPEPSAWTGAVLTQTIGPPRGSDPAVPHFACGQSSCSGSLAYSTKPRFSDVSK